MHSESVLVNMTCQPCPPGTHVQTPCKDSSPSCVPCKRGYYNPEWTTSRACRPCTRSCQGHKEIQLKACTRTSDLQCTCPTGYYHYKPGPGESNCLSYLECIKGDGVVVQGTNETNVKCDRCVEGKTFSDVQNYYSPCKLCTRCSDLGFEELDACTTVSDATCKIITTPKPKQPPSTNVIDFTSDTPAHDTNIVTIATIAGVVGGIILVVLVVMAWRICRKKRLCRQRSQERKREDSKTEDGVGSTDPLNPNGQEDIELGYVCTAKSLPEVTRTRRRSIGSPPPLGALIKPRSDSSLMSPTINENPMPFLGPPKKMKKGEELTDVFIWVGTKFGQNGYQSFLLSLPSESETGRLSAKRDIDAIEFKYKDDHREVIREGLEKWREINEEKTDDEILIDVYKCMVVVDRCELAQDLHKRFADN